MKTIKGLPISVKIDSEAALKETERLMLRASESTNLSPSDERHWVSSITLWDA